MSDFNLKVWRLHPRGARFEKAEKTLHGQAHSGGTKFCRPYSSANQLGWWLFPPVDVDIWYTSEGEMGHEVLEPYTDVEHALVRSMVTDSDNVRIQKKHPGPPFDIENFCPVSGGRTKFTWNAVEPRVVQIWTGCIFETPPGWGLQIRSPVNCGNPGYHVMEGFLETDWMQYDIWVNLVIDATDQKVEIRKDQWPPLAHIVPMRRESVDADWSMQEEVLNRDTPEGNRVFEFWTEYNHRKYGMGGNQFLTEERSKDGTTYYKVRREYLDPGTMEPEKEVPSACPFKKSMKPRYIKKKS